MPAGAVERAKSWYAGNEVLAWVSVLIAVNQLGFGSIVPVVPLYAASFGVSKALIGLTIAVYGAARFLASMPGGRLADSAGRRWSLATGGLITVLGNLLCGAAGSYGMFLLGRFVAGMGASLVLTSGQIILTDISTPANRGRMMALYQAVFMFAVGIGPLPGGYLAKHGGLAFPFFVYAALGAGVSLLALLRVPETRALAHSRVATGPKLGFAGQVRLLTANPPFLMVALISFAAAFGRTGALFNLVPQRAENVIGLDTSQIGLGLAAISLVSLLVAYPAGVIVDRYGRKAVIVPSTVLSGLALTSFALAPSYLWFLVACFTWALATGISASAPAAYAADLAPSGMNAAAMSTYRMIADCGYVIGPALLGWLADQIGSGTSIFVAAGLILLVGAGFAVAAPESYRASRPAPAPRTQQAP